MGYTCQEKNYKNLNYNYKKKIKDEYKSLHQDPLYSQEEGRRLVPCYRAMLFSPSSILPTSSG